MPKKELTQGIIEAYIHPNKKIGAMVELRCETDFVARTEEFKKLAHELCLQVAAMNPLFLKTEDIPEKFLAGERKIFEEQFRDSGKPKKMAAETSPHLPERSEGREMNEVQRTPPRPTSEGSAIDEMVEGKLEKYKEEISFLSQAWIRDETKTVKDLFDEYAARFGENIIIKRFVRYEL